MKTGKLCRPKSVDPNIRSLASYNRQKILPRSAENPREFTVTVQLCVAACTSKFPFGRVDGASLSLKKCTVGLLKKTSIDMCIIVRADIPL